MIDGSDETQERGHAWKTPAEVAADVAQANALRAQAAKAGLRFDAYATPEAADWMLGEIARGTFSDPQEAVFVLLREAIELGKHPDLKRELLKRQIKASLDDPRPDLSEEEVLERLEQWARERDEPAVWRKQI